jgi:transposase InsO family protein
VEEAAMAAGVSIRTAYKWLSRADEVGDRSSRPRRSPQWIGSERENLILKLRRSRMTGSQIGQRLGLARTTVARVLRKNGLARLKNLDPPQPVIRYEHTFPGSLLHLDTKKLARIRGVGHRIHGDQSHRQRGVGWEFAHVAIDDFTRLAYVEILPDERGSSMAFFLLRALAFFRRHGIRIRRVLTDNGRGYISHAFEKACQSFRIRHRFTRPYRPQTNGKAERFIQTLIREWAYARPYTSSRKRTETLPLWLRLYNHQRPHASLGAVPPFSRLQLHMNNVLRIHN